MTHFLNGPFIQSVTAMYVRQIENAYNRISRLYIYIYIYIYRRIDKLLL